MQEAKVKDVVFDNRRAIGNYACGTIVEHPRLRAGSRVCTTAVQHVRSNGDFITKNTYYTVVKE